VKQLARFENTATPWFAGGNGNLTPDFNTAKPGNDQPEPGESLSCRLTTVAQMAPLIPDFDS